MMHLSDVLGGELDTLSSAGKGRLSALSQQTGAQIAALMKRTDLTDQERAQELARIKAEAAQQARIEYKLLGMRIIFFIFV